MLLDPCLALSTEAPFHRHEFTPSIWQLFKLVAIKSACIIVLIVKDSSATVHQFGVRERGEEFPVSSFYSFIKPS